MTPRTMRQMAHHDSAFGAIRTPRAALADWVRDTPEVNAGIEQCNPKLDRLLER
jgi:hypothetical protein